MFRVCKSVVMYVKVLSMHVLLLVVLLSLIKCSDKHTPPLPELVDYNFDIKPILVQKCYLCHGPDSSSRKAGLRLDTYEGSTAALKEGGQAIIPGHPSNSKLVDRINSQDPELVMPPPDTKQTLTEREIAVLTKWIKQGADWKPHWSFIPPAAPDLRGLTKDENEIDFLVEKKIKQRGLELAPEANKNSLIRRVSYLLTGLPPSREALRIYLADNSSNSYENMVDRYLNSPRYGEKWARNWMDVVRYAETKGHEFDYTIAGAWRYRDYLIRAFNEDLPYDQFVKEQLAGDLLPMPRRHPTIGTNESQLGTVFYTMAEGSHSPVDVRKDEADRIDNMIDVTTKTFQGLTVSCARCHDHKFDPISTADYYSLYGVMESSRFSPVAASLTLSEEKNMEEVRNIDSYIRNKVADHWGENRIVAIGKKHNSSTEAKQVGTINSSEYTLLGDFRGRDLNGWKSDGLAFGSKTTLGNPVFNKQSELVRLATGKASSRGISMGIFGALRSPDFIINKKFIGVRAAGKKATIRIIIDNFQLISYPIYGGIEKRVDNEAGQNFIFDVSLWKGHKAYIEIMAGEFSAHVYSLAKDAFVEVDYALAYDEKWIDPDHGRQGSYTLENSVQHWKNFNTSSQQVDWLNELLRKQALLKKIPGVSESLARRQQLLEGVYDSTFYNGIREGFGINSPVFVRGSHKELTRPVPRRFLSALPSKDTVFRTAGSGRMELADEIINPQNPLMARVMVNRIWYQIFGRGIVETVDNFGLQGKLPSHPELLDFLAIKFQKEGWSVKRMIKSIAMSTTFRRSTNAMDGIEKSDPDNVLLSHFPVLRLEAEDVRDGLLAVSGRLDTAMFGPPVPVHVTDFMQGRGRPQISGPLDGAGRRSIYQEVRRNFLEPLMLAFDRPVPFTTFGKRNTTNVPSQSLILMNDPFVILQAELMTKNLLDQNKLSFDDRLKWIYQRAFSRDPSSGEIEKAKSFIINLARLYAVKDQDVLMSVDIWKDYCHTIFNSKEFIYLI